MCVGKTCFPAHAYVGKSCSPKTFFFFGKGNFLEAESELHACRTGQVTQTRERLQHGGKTRGGQAAVPGTQ